MEERRQDGFYGGVAKNILLIKYLDFHKIPFLMICSVIGCGSFETSAGGKRLEVTQTGTRTCLQCINIPRDFTLEYSRFIGTTLVAHKPACRLKESPGGTPATLEQFL